MLSENQSLLPANVPSKGIQESSESIAREPLLKSPVENQSDKLALACPACHEPYRLGELLCMRCGTIFSPNTKTHRLEGYDQTRPERIRRVGQAIVQAARPLIFEVGDQEITLPMKDVLVLGRAANSPSEPGPDVDLTSFNAHEKGVSRLHAKIQRDSDLLHIIDLKSLNGTYLNGFKLVPQQERLLRWGDEVILGHLKLRLKF
jgi:hypothetical protein